MKTLLLPFYDDDQAAGALDTAHVLARQNDAYVEGLFVLRPPQIFDGEGIALAGSYLSQLKEEGRRLADGAKSRFESALEAKGLTLGTMGVAGDGPSVAWRELEGLEGQVIGDHGRLFDLIIIGREFGRPWLDWQVMCEAALFESGRPLLVAPTTAPAAIGSRILIAWNRSTETARSVHFAMPFMAKARQVTVLSIEGWHVPGPPGEELAAHLMRNGIRAEARTVAAGNTGEIILHEAASREVDLLVKGAFTQSRLRQLVFGGATRHIMANAAMPVLMAH